MELNVFQRRQILGTSAHHLSGSEILVRQAGLFRNATSFLFDGPFPDDIDHGQPRVIRQGHGLIVSKLKFRKGPKARDSRRMVNKRWGNSQVFYEAGS
jgi:hypothetical protein